MKPIRIRQAQQEDIPALSELFHCLWPEAGVVEHAKELGTLGADRLSGPFPDVVIVAEEQGRLVGFIEIDLRSHADGCTPSHAVGYIEGWYVEAAYRRRRIGASLVAAAEDWAREQGCTEIASDAWLDSLDSQHAHEALGFEVVDRCVHYRKDL